MAMLHPKSYQNMDIVYITVVAVLAKVMEGIQMLFFSASVNVFSWVSGRRLWSWNLILCNEIKQGKKSCTPSDVGLSTQVRCSAEFQKSRPPNRWMPISELKSRVTLPKQRSYSIDQPRWLWEFSLCQHWQGSSQGFPPPGVVVVCPVRLFRD